MWCSDGRCIIFFIYVTSLALDGSVSQLAIIFCIDHYK